MAYYGFFPNNEEHLNYFCYIGSLLSGTFTGQQ